MLQPRLKSKISVPYGGLFVLDVPEKGMVGRGTSFNHLLGNLKTYRLANAIPIGLSFEDEVEREICLRYPSEAVETDRRVPPSDVRLTYDDVLNGTKMLLKFKLAGSPLVDDAEAKRRASICAQCGFQSDYSRPCGGPCGPLKDLIVQIVGAKSTGYENRLRACRVCKCVNEANVWVPLKHSMEYLTPLQLERFEYAHTEFGCWKHL